MNKRSFTKLVCVLLVAVFVLSAIPFTVSAASEVTQIKTAAELVSGKYVIATVDGVALASLDGTWVVVQKVEAKDGKITGVEDALLWDITVDGTSAKLKDSNGKTIAPKGGNSNGIMEGDYSWTVSVVDGKFIFKGVGADTVTLASNVGSDNKFRGYKNTTVAGNPEGYPSELCLYKVSGTSEEAAPTYVPVKDAVAAESSAVVHTSGTVIFIDGKNVVINDGTAGINLYLKTADTTLKVGDVVKAKGTRGAFNGLEQLGNAEILEKVSSGAAINHVEKTVAEILADQESGLLESTPVLLKGVTIGAVNSSGNTAVTDVDGSTINIYKCPALDGIAEGDKVNLKVIVSDYKGYQLRVVSAADVEKVVEEVTTPEVTTPEVTTPEVTTPETTAPVSGGETGTSDTTVIFVALALIAGAAVAVVTSKKAVRK